MQDILLGIKQAFDLLVSGDPEVWEIVWLTLRVSGSATLVSLLMGIPGGVFLALSRFPGRRLLISVVNTFMGMPPVTAGLWVFLLLVRSGPLGFLDLIFTPEAMVVAQAVIASPIVMGLTMAAVQSIDPKLHEQLLGLGASRWQLLWTLVREARYSLLAAVIAGFGAVVSEVGASMMVGGNVKGMTRVLTTATVLAVSKGNYALGIALTVILMLLAYLVTALLTALQQGGSQRYDRI